MKVFLLLSIFLTILSSQSFAQQRDIREIEFPHKIVNEYFSEKITSINWVKSSFFLGTFFENQKIKISFFTWQNDGRGRVDAYCEWGDEQIVAFNPNGYWLCDASFARLYRMGGATIIIILSQEDDEWTITPINQ